MPIPSIFLATPIHRPLPLAAVTVLLAGLLGRRARRPGRVLVPAKVPVGRRRV